MTFEDKLLLIKAGYTKSDIEAMEGSPAPAPAPAHAQAPETPTAMTPEQYAQLLQAINRGNANIDMPPTSEATVENMLAGRLKSAFTSANREEENK